MNHSITARIANYISWVLVFILVMLPFHEFLTTWLGSNIGHLDALRIWKEIVLLLSVPFIIYLIWKKPKLKDWFKKDPLIYLALAYSILSLGMGLWAYKSGRVNKSALADGLILNLRILLVFFICQVIATYSDYIKKHWQPILLMSATIAILLGIAQLFLPIDFLRHFGYGANTIPAYSTVDQKVQYRRIQSTLRGPNPLGTYLILVLPAFAIKLRKNRWFKLTMLVIGLAALFFTYSRGAYLGLGLTFLALYYLLWITNRWRRRFIIIVGVFCVVLALGIYGLRYNSVAQNIFFHTSKNSAAPMSSNAQHAGALETGLKQVLKEPLGSGIGTAGPASERNSHPARIAENYFVQIAQEVGIEGLVLFLAIYLIIGYRLWRARADPLASLLLASLVGITFVNMLSHAWTDDTISLLWWGLAGIALKPAILNKDKQLKNSNDKEKKVLKKTQEA